MSANNQLIIYQPSEDSSDWTIKEVDVDTGSEYSQKFYTHVGLIGAIREADKYMEENEVEYGYYIKLPPER